MFDIEKLALRSSNLEQINSVIRNPSNPLIKPFMDVVTKFGSAEEINEEARKARDLETIKSKLKAMNSPYLADLEWLEEQKANGTFVSMDEYYNRVLGSSADTKVIRGNNPVTLEISAMQFFPWLIHQAQHAIRNREIMPGRYIRVRNMKESEADQGDLMAMAAAMEIIGASYVETLDTKGTDGSNVHLGGPDTIAGYFGGMGMPNDYPVKWLEEYLYYYTNFGIKQVLNISPGQLMVGYWLNRLGIDNEFKVSVFYAGHDSAYGVFYTLMMAKLMEREDGRGPLIGLNLSNSVNAETIRQISALREMFGMTDRVRIEHHITESYRSIVRQPYLRRDELIDVAKTVRNIAAKHEGGDPNVEEHRNQPSSVLDYFLTKEELLRTGYMSVVLQGYMDRHQSVNRTADALTKAGIGIIPALHLHG